MERKGSAIWRGDLQTGQGRLTTDSRVLDDAEYGFRARFEAGAGTNPEELIGAAHAGCFAMALSMILGERGFTAEEIRASAAVTLEEVEDGFAITRIRLEAAAKAPGASEADFLDAAEAAKAGCPVSKLLNAEITLDARLVT